MSISKRKILLVLFGIAVLMGISLYAASYQETGPVYSLEGAWYGMVTITSPVTINSPSLDTFTSNAQRQGFEGTFLCTISAFPNSTDSGHGNWVRIGTNTFAYTAVHRDPALAAAQYYLRALVGGVVAFELATVPGPLPSHAGTLNLQ